ncbi:MAG TPA: protein kinase [Pyrinomonadaceae bacterium]|nr:protein kinase [Pyrinomonadaceae bacterium]
MKLCQKCNRLALDEQNYCAHDGQLLAADALATALQESVGAKYTVSRLIGTGSMGAVYRAQHHALDDVAIKVMLGPPDNHKLSERFLREARALRKLHHPNAVLVYDLERSDTGLTYMVMEMVEGRSLRDELRARGRLTLPETLEIAEAVCDALEAAHEHGIIHRDLKPDNILLADERMADGDVSRIIKIVDFGIVKLRGTQQGGEEASMQLTKYGTPIGTPFYMSPEQWFGDGPGFTGLDGRTDIYALGCTLYEMLSGYPPFLGKTKDEMRRRHLNEPPHPLTKAVPHVPEAVSRVILRAIEKDRDFRPSSAAEFAAELRRAYTESVGPENLEEERERSRHVTANVLVEEQPGPEQVAQLQTTEESVPLVRNWAADEAQQAMQQVREQPVTHPQPEAPQAPRQGFASPVEGEVPPAEEMLDLEATLVAGSFRAIEGLSDQATLVSFVAESAEQRSALPVAAPSEREARELVVAQAGERVLGLFADEVENVCEWRVPAPLPHAPPAVMGVVSVRGRMLTVLDPLILLGGEGRPGTMNGSNGSIIALRGDEQLGLAVDRVVSTIEIYLDEIGPADEGAGESVCRGVIRGEHGETIVLDVRELFDAAMRRAERRRQRTS